VKILIICTDNSCRSQMAHGFLQSFDSDLEVYSAGTKPADRVQPYSVQVMSELDINISAHTPQHVNQYIGTNFDYVISVCDGAKEVCPVFTGSVRNRLHMGFDDPYDAIGTENEILGEYRRVRDEIKQAFQDLYDKTLKNEIHSS